MTRVCEKKPKTLQSTHSLARMRPGPGETHDREKHFNPRIPSQECDPVKLFTTLSMPLFQSTHSLARMRPGRVHTNQDSSEISIHALPRKNATGVGPGVWEGYIFQSTHSLARMRHVFGLLKSPQYVFQSTHSLARMRPGGSSGGVKGELFQSTHSLARMRLLC